MTIQETFLCLVTVIDGWLSLHHQCFHQSDDETFLYLKTAHETFLYLKTAHEIFPYLVAADGSLSLYLIAYSLYLLLMGFHHCLKSMD